MSRPGDILFIHYSGHGTQVSAALDIVWLRVCAAGKVAADALPQCSKCTAAAPRCLFLVLLLVLCRAGWSPGCWLLAQVPVTDHDPNEEETDMMDEAIVPCDMVRDWQTLDLQSAWFGTKLSQSVADPLLQSLISEQR